MWAVKRRPVGRSSVPAAMPIRSAYFACQQGFEPPAGAKGGRGARWAEGAAGVRDRLGAVDPAQPLSCDDEMLFQRRGERADVAAPAAALDAVAEAAGGDPAPPPAGRG